MPNFGPLIPNPFKPIDEEAAAALKKASFYAIALGATFGIAPYFPKTTSKFTKLAFGIEITPGRGVILKPAVVVNLLPQPIGVMPPRAFGLPQGMADIEKIADIFRKKEGARNYFKQFPESLNQEDEAQLAKVRAKLSVTSYSDLIQLRGQLEPTSLSGDYFEKAKRAVEAEIAFREQFGNPAAAAAALEAHIAAEFDKYHAALEAENTAYALLQQQLNAVEQFFARNPPDP